MNNQPPLISIIIPVYNAENYIEETIQSVLNQTYKEWEMLIIDDGSTDGSKENINNYLSDSRIRYYYKENGGQGSARNVGIKESNGEYLAFLDADDLWDQDKLEIQMDIFLDNEVELVYSKVRCIDSQGKNLKRDLGKGKGIFKGFRAFFLLAENNIMIPNLSVVALKKSVIDAGGFNEDEWIRNIEDYDMWFRMILKGNIIYGNDKVLGSYRIHDQQSTYSNPGSSLKLIRLFNKMSLDRPGKEKYFEYLILKRLSFYYKLHGMTNEAGKKCIEIIMTTSSVNSKWPEKCLMSLLGIKKFLRFSELKIRKFRRYKSFIEKIRD